MRSQGALTVRVEDRPTSLEQEAGFLYAQFQVRIAQHRFFSAAEYIARRLPEELSHDSARTQYIREAFRKAISFGGRIGARQCGMIALRYPDAINDEMLTLLQELEQTLTTT
jgi:hypothetical protein